MPKNQKKIMGSFIRKKKPHFVKNAKFQRKKISKKLDGVLPAMSRLRLNNYAKKNPQVHTKTTQEKSDEELRSVWKRMDKLRKDFYGQEKKLEGNPPDEKKVNHNEKPSSEQNVKTKKIKKKTSSEQNMNEKTENVNKNEKPSSVKNEKKESLDGKIKKKKLKTDKKKKPVIRVDVPEDQRPAGKKEAVKKENKEKNSVPILLKPGHGKHQIHKINFDEGKNTVREYEPQAYEYKLMPGGQQNDMMMMVENTTNGHLLIGGQNKRSMWVDSNYSSSSSQNNHSSSDHDTKNDDSNRWTNNHFNQEEELINENEEIIKAMNDQRMNSFLYGVNGSLGSNNSSAFPGSSVRSD
jgi:hypothetical protein